MAEWKKQVVYSEIEEYEIEGGMLTLAYDRDHDVVIPLFQVETVDIRREPRE
jgi:hypothetical protein